jgi:hypothetical protein
MPPPAASQHRAHDSSCDGRAHSVDDRTLLRCPTASPAPACALFLDRSGAVHRGIGRAPWRANSTSCRGNAMTWQHWMNGARQRLNVARRDALPAAFFDRTEPLGSRQTVRGAMNVARQRSCQQPAGRANRVVERRLVVSDAGPRQPATRTSAGVGKPPGSKAAGGARVDGTAGVMGVSLMRAALRRC